MNRAKLFAKRHGSFLRVHAKRISSLVEIAVYNSIVEYYDKHGYTLSAVGLGPRKSFVYRLGTTGLIENFSYFVGERRGRKAVVILQNVKIQSAHHDHLYYTPDVVVCRRNAAVTEKLANGRRHSFIKNRGLITFIEVKHLVPFPEVLFSFSGLVQEFAPSFISGRVKTSRRKRHLTPMIVFTGAASRHSDTIKVELEARYGINVVYNTQKADGRIASFARLRKYNPSRRRVRRR